MSATVNSTFVSDCAFLGRNLFPVKQAARDGVVPIFDNHQPKA